MILLGLCTACTAPATESVASGAALTYQIVYTVVAHPADGTLDVTMRVRQPRGLLRELRFPASSRIVSSSADGDLQIDATEIVWRPPVTGGSLRWTVVAANRRNGNGYDAWLGEDWAILRAEDIIPRASTRTLVGATSQTTMQFDLPDGWSVVTAYAGNNGKFAIDKQDRRFDQPNGWIALGHLGTRRETIAGVHVAITGPTGQAIRRMDTLALLNWTLPELARVLQKLPPRLTVVSAGDPMWRGGLSAPQSLYVHAERPLISENATSTLLHEVMHSTLRITTKPGYDWIVEGLAEYYSLELLRRSGSISQSRHSIAMREQARWSKSAKKLCQPASSGAVTALAVVVFAALDAEIRETTENAASLDDLLRQLQFSPQPADLQSLTQIAEQLSNAKSNALHIDNLPGCRNISPSSQEKH